MTDRREGCLIIIGGHEDRDPRGKRLILREVARHVRGGKLVLASCASPARSATPASRRRSVRSMSAAGSSRGRLPARRS